MGIIRNVYIDIRPLLDERISGIGRYVEELLVALQRVLIEKRHREVSYHFLAPKSPYSHRLDIFDKNLFPRINLRFDHITLNYLTRYGLFPPIDLLLEKGLFIFPNYGGIPVLKSEAITFIYDLSFVIVPEFVHPGNRKYLTNAVPKQIKRSKSCNNIGIKWHIIIEHYGVCADNVS
jgi:hypothetical protein